MLRTTLVLSLRHRRAPAGPLAEQRGVVGPMPLLELKPEQLRLSTRRIGDRLYHSLVHAASADYDDRTLLTYSAVDGDHSTIWQLRLAPAP